MTLETKGLDTLSLVLVKAHLVIEHALDDTLIQHYMDMSFDTAETYLNHSLTDEVYNTLDIDTIYSIPYKPKKVELYLIDVLVKEVEFSYCGFELVLDLDGTEVYDEVVAYVDGANDNSVVQARLLQIASSYKVRENEDFSNMKANALGFEFLMDMNTQSFL